MISSILCLEAEDVSKVSNVWDFLVAKLLEVPVPERTDGRFVGLGEFLSELKLLFRPEHRAEPGRSTHAFQFLGKVLFVLLLFKGTELASNFLLGEMAREGKRKKKIYLVTGNDL